MDKTEHMLKIKDGRILVRLCPTGFDLYKIWKGYSHLSKTQLDMNRASYYAMKAYFNHRNGDGDDNSACRFCEYVSLPAA